MGDIQQHNVTTTQCHKNTMSQQHNVTTTQCHNDIVQICGIKLDSAAYCLKIQHQRSDTHLARLSGQPLLSGDATCSRCKLLKTHTMLAPCRSVRNDCIILDICSWHVVMSQVGGNTNNSEYIHTWRGIN